MHSQDLGTNVARSSDDDDSNAIDAGISTGAGLIDMAFSKSKVEDRKRWLNRAKKDTFSNSQRGRTYLM